MFSALKRWLAGDGMSPGEASIRTGSLALADQFVASATTFATGIIVGRSCSQEEFGLYMLGFSIVILAMRLQMALISTPFTVFVPQLEGASRFSYTGSTLIHQLALSVVAVLLLLSFGVVLSFGVGPHGLDSVVWALAVAISFILLREYGRNVCFALLDFVTALILDLCISVVQILGLLFLASKGLLTAHAAILVIGSACALAISIWLMRTRSSIHPRLGRAVIDLKNNWNFGRWIFLSGVMWEATLVLYPWILTYFHGTASTGIWAACLGVVAVANPILLGMQNFLGPKIAHSFAGKETMALRSVVYRFSAAFSLIVAPIVAIIFLFGDRIVAALYGAKYSGHGLVVSLLAIDLLTAPFRFSLSRALFSMDRADLDTATNVLPFLVLLVVGIWLIDAYSVIGVAASILLGNIVVTLVKFIVFLAIQNSQNLELQK